MPMADEKRMVAETNYAVRCAIHIGDSEVLVAEDMKEPDGMYYFVANYRNNGLIGEYSDCQVSGDYLEIMQEFTNRLTVQIEKANERNSTADFQTALITEEQCYPNDYRQSIDGKVVAIKASALRPEYRRGDVQLVLVNGGNGSHANARGSAVFCYHLNDGHHTRFERYDVLGEIKPEHMPDWAKENLSKIKQQMKEKKSHSREER